MKRGNSINIISKLNFKLTNKIPFNDWLWPWSIHSSNDRIYTIAYALDDNAIWSKNGYQIK